MTPHAALGCAHCGPPMPFYPTPSPCKIVPNVPLEFDLVPSQEGSGEASGKAMGLPDFCGATAP